MIAILPEKSGIDHQTVIDDWILFSFRSAVLRSNRSLKFVLRSIPDFHFEIDPRLKTDLLRSNTDGAKDRDPIFF